MRDAKPSERSENDEMSEYILLQKVQAKMAQLYSAIDAFKANLISDASDLVRQQTHSFGQMVEQSKTASKVTDDCN